MKIYNFEINKFFVLILSIQFALWSAIGLDIMGFQIPIIRQLIGFVYLTFIPGILLLRILGLHKLNNIETLLYTVGLSIVTLMFTGFFMNLIYPIFGVSGPISEIPLVTTISLLVLVLCYASYKRDGDFSNPSFIEVKDVLSPPVLVLCLIPFLAIFGTYLVNFHHNNILLMFLIVALAIIVILIGFDKLVPKKLYPLAVFGIAISLLYHRSLITMYLTGTDIHLEHYLCNIVIWGSHWDPSIPMTVNAMLSIVMLAPIYSIITGMDPTWVFKIIYPFLFSLVPLGLYSVFQRQTDDKIAFLSCFFFVSTQSFYGLMLGAARQQIAELFFVLLISLMVNTNIDKIRRSFLFIIFGISLVISHYGVAYIFMFTLIAAWLIFVLMSNPAIQKLGGDFYAKFSRCRIEKFAGNSNSLKIEDRKISSTYVRLFVIFTLTWYIYISNSVTFDSIVRIIDHIISGISDILNPEMTEGLWAISTELSISRTITRYLYLITQFFISIGIFMLLLKPSELKFNREYSTFSLIFFIMLLVSLAVPYTSTSMTTGRVYHVALFFLAPFCAIGCIIVFRAMGRVIKRSWTSKVVKSSLKILSVFFAIYLLFNTGLVCEVIKDDPPNSISLNNTVKHRQLFDEGEVRGSQWLVDTGKDESDIYVDNFGELMLRNFVHNIDRVKVFTNESRRVDSKSYVLMGLANVKDDKIEVLEWKKSGMLEYHHPTLSNSTFHNSVIINANKIYEGRYAQIYYTVKGVT